MDSLRAIQSSPPMSSTCKSSLPIASHKICLARAGFAVSRGGIRRIDLYTTNIPDSPDLSSRTRAFMRGFET
jgi:hypothetical protein